MLYMQHYPNQLGSMMRNPNQARRESVKIVSELDVHGRIRLVHTFIDQGCKKHREYSFTKAQLKEFLKQNQDLVIEFDQNQSQFSDTYHSVQSPHPMMPGDTFHHLEYRGQNLPLPRSSFEASFQQKHEPNGMPRMGVGPALNGAFHSNISGNEIDYQVNTPTNFSG